jgi:hypothetical protein
MAQINDNSDLNLDELIQKLDKITKYTDTKKEDEYLEKMNNILNNLDLLDGDGLHNNDIQESLYKKIIELDNTKYQDIRKELNNDQNFEEIKNKQQSIEDKLKQNELLLTILNKKLNMLKNPSFMKKLTTNMKNVFNSNKQNFNEDRKNTVQQIEKIINETKMLKKIIEEINFLIPIYEKSIEDVQHMSMNAGKRKTRRNRKRQIYKKNIKRSKTRRH